MGWKVRARLAGASPPILLDCISVCYEILLLRAGAVAMTERSAVRSLLQARAPKARCSVVFWSDLVVLVFACGRSEVFIGLALASELKSAQVCGLLRCFY